MTERKRHEAQLEESLVEKNALLRELCHRTKNNMQVICSMFNMRSEQLRDEGNDLPDYLCRNGSPRSR